MTDIRLKSIPVREIMSIVFSYRSTPEIEESITLWDTECVQWLIDNAQYCRNLKVEPLSWEKHYDDFSTGVCISMLKKPPNTKVIKNDYVSIDDSMI